MIGLLALLAACSQSPVELLVPSAHAQDAAAPAARLYGLGGTLYVQVYKDPNTIAAAAAHDHVVKASGWNGSVTWDAANLAACKVQITVPVSSLSVDEKGLREQLGYDTFPSDSERADIKTAMLSDAQLDSAKYPSISYQSTKCEQSGDLVNVTGNLTIHGVTKSVVLPMSVKADAVNFSAKGSIKIRASQFGMTPYSALFGAVKNQDSMILVIDVTGKPR